MSQPMTVEFIDMLHHWRISEIHPFADVVLVLGHLGDGHSSNLPPIVINPEDGSAGWAEPDPMRLEPLFTAD